ncbi:MAG: nucleotidyltransferase domain-containing protein [Phormidesmis sp.]
MQSKSIDPILNSVVEWAESCGDILAVALVGSWARGTAHANSDIDLMFLTPDPRKYQISQEWMHEIGWKAPGCKVKHWQDKNYGIVWSRHVYLKAGTAIEFSFGASTWAEVQPIDRGTLGVVKDGCAILYDPAKILAKLIAAAKMVPGE